MGRMTKRRWKRICHNLKLWLLSLGTLVDKRLVDVRDNSSSCDGSLDQGIEFLISTNCKLKMSWCDTLYLKILTCVTSKFEYFCGEVFKDSRSVYSSRCSHTLTGLYRALQETVYTTYWELLMAQKRREKWDYATSTSWEWRGRTDYTYLKSSLGRTRLWSLLCGWSLSSFSSLTSFATFSRLQYWRVEIKWLAG